MLRLAGITNESVVDGPGVRLVVFAQGCPHHCPGCHNPETWAMDGGTLVSIDKILMRLQSNPVLSGVTLSGGEPFAQATEFGRLAVATRAMGLSVMTYTGYTMEQLLTMPEAVLLLEHTDILVDGPYIEALRSPRLKWRGSYNQSIIKMPDCRKHGSKVGRVQ